MDSGLFIITITCYLLCTVATLIASFFTRFIADMPVKILLSVHIAFLVLYFLMKDQIVSVAEPGPANYFFLAFFCSGVLLSGIVLRKKMAVAVKVYFALFLVSMIFFLFTPSRMIGFIASGNPESFSPPRYHVSENYYLVGQNRGENNSGGGNGFKLVREMGFFHKTLSRNIDLPAGTDSVALRKFEPDSLMRILVYYSQNNRPDSTLMDIPLVIYRDSSRVITRKISSPEK